MRILGIETSCDETSAAVVVGGTWVLSNVISSQIALHQAHGGVVPELAARAHVTALVPVVRAALAEAAVAMNEIDAVSVTRGPGLAGSLLVGVNAAKAMAYVLDRPLIAVNHLEAHVAANWLRQPGAEADPPDLPAVCLLVSGGHTELLLVERPGRFRLLGRTLDDAAGEAFDKGARLLGLGYPGGPAIQRAAEGGNSAAFDLPRALPGDSLDFSFSGLKTALLRLIAPYRLPDPPRPVLAPGLFAEHRAPSFKAGFPVADLAASFQAAIVDVLVDKTMRAAAAMTAKSVLLAGGVAANRVLRDALAAEAANAGMRFHVPPFAFCTDNAARIAGAAHQALRRGEQAGWDLDIDPRLQLKLSSDVNVGRWEI
jgi:N6-L-threonylcarbamoyladenine synthase